MSAAIISDYLFQPVSIQSPLRVIRLEGGVDEPLQDKLWHHFHMLYWSTEGSGVIRVGYQDFEWLPQRVFYFQRRQLHQVLQYPKGGWMILFSEMVFRDFIRQNPGHDGLGLFDLFNPLPFVELDTTMLDSFNLIAGNLMGDGLGRNSLPVMQYYLSVLLLYASGQYRASHQLNFNLQQAELVRKIKSLIDCYYLSSREPAFYAKHLGVPTRRLNGICRCVTGKGVYELVTDRLLTECESLLAAQAKPVKEICFEMGFSDPANFTTFFKKHRGMTPVEFRAMVASGGAKL